MGVLFCVSALPVIKILDMLRRILPRSGALRATPSTLLQRAVYQNVRQYSIKLDAAATTRPNDIDPSRLVLQETKSPKPLQKQEDLVFGATFTGNTAPPGQSYHGKGND